MGVHARIVHHPIQVDALLGKVGADGDGAVLLFLGTVRNHNEGRAVRGMRYDAYDAMARQVLEEILEEARSESGVDRLAAEHRVGELEIGEVSVAIAVSSPHREPAYRASRYVIEEIKKRLPVWKKEFYVAGDEVWVRGVDPRAGATAEVSGSPTGSARTPGAGEEGT